MKICVLGTGSFGTSLAIHLSNNVKTISMWSIDKDVIHEINTERTNSSYLDKSFKLSDNTFATNDLELALKDATYIIIAVPSHAIKSVCSNISKHIHPNQTLINLAKGIDASSLERLSVVIETSADTKNIVTLSGPSHAEEIVKNIPTTIVAASSNIKLAEKVQKDLSTKTLRIYTNTDVVGVELGGASKNIIALASGILDGLGFGDNAKAALMVRGMSEIITIGTHLGGKEQTFSGLSGMGDMIVTCTSKHSRNRLAGELLAKGYSLDDTLKEVGMVVEGINACKNFKKLSAELNIELPITNALYEIIFDNKCASVAIKELMCRELKSEF